MAKVKSKRTGKKSEAAGSQQPGSRSSEEPETMGSVLKRLEEIEAQLAQEKEENQQLQAIIDDLRTDGEGEGNLSPEEDIIPRPRGTAGTDWSLQVEMGLATSMTNFGKYKALLRGIRDLVLNANIKWEVGWRDIPPSDKAKMFQVGRERYPILKRYANDWATAEIAKQFIKNKRAHHYKNGWLPVPEKYAYLKKNASKRSPTGSRIKHAKIELAAKKRAKRNEALQAKSVLSRPDAEGSEAEEDEDTDEE